MTKHHRLSDVTLTALAVLMVSCSVNSAVKENALPEPLTEHETRDITVGWVRIHGKLDPSDVRVELVGRYGGSVLVRILN